MNKELNEIYDKHKKIFEEDYSFVILVLIMQIEKIDTPEKLDNLLFEIEKGEYKLLKGVKK